MTQQHDPLSGNHRRAILIAEDDPDQSDMLREALEDEGYRVDTAFSGDVALRKLVEHDYGLVVMDVRMPGLDGITVLRRYRKERKGPQAPVVVISAFATDSELASYREAGADAAFAKPYDLNQLLSKISESIAIRENKTSSI
jgi:DNA-binding response OmpR family regulator